MPDPMGSVETRLWLGASWYPEMWPEAEWSKDTARMKELGFNIVRLFEFAWHKFEPREGVYEMDWALRVMDQCHRDGLAVMVGTPTAAPPAWLTTAYPEVLQTRADGSRMTHGQRKHYSHFSKTYRELSARIVRKMAETFSGHPALHSWQIDNEMSGSDFSAETKALFHEWLRKRYGTIENLNAAWGLEFWSQAYDDFSQIPMPQAAVGSIEMPERHHPSLVMAVARHRNDGWSEFIRAQVDVIREYSDKPVTSNMTPGMGMNWFQHNRHLDRVGHSLYRDVLHYQWNLPFFDRMRAEKPDRSYWMLETAPSWSAGGRIWNIHHDAEGVQAMTWKSVFLGGSMMLFWQWREHWAGQEMQHGVLVSATGKWRPNKEAMQQLSAGFRRAESWLGQHPPAPAPLALVLSNEASWAFSIDPIDDDMVYEKRFREDYYLPLARAQYWRDVIHESADFGRYQILALPHMPMVAAETRERLAAWVRAGGTLVLGPFTGYRTEEFTAFRDRDFGGLEELIGAESSLRFAIQWVSDKVRIVFADGHITRSGALAEAWEPGSATVLARYEGGYGDGRAAIVRNRVGEGTVVTLGCKVEPATWLRLMSGLLSEKGIAPVAGADPDVVVVPRADRAGRVRGFGVVNLATESRSVTLPWAGEDLLTGTRTEASFVLPPLGRRLVVSI